MREIYRIELPDGEGIYRADRTQGKLPRHLLDPSKRRPTPIKDHKLLAQLPEESTGEMRFGFPTRDALFRWFNPRELGELGRVIPDAQITRYKVARLIAESDHQCVFLVREAVREDAQSLIAYAEAEEEEQTVEDDETWERFASAAYGESTR